MAKPPRHHTTCTPSPSYQFYKDAACTELWKDNELAEIRTDKSGTGAPGVFCKKNPGTISPKADESVTILTITLEY